MTTDDSEFTTDGEDPGYNSKWKFDSENAQPADGRVRIGHFSLESSIVGESWRPRSIAFLPKAPHTIEFLLLAGPTRTGWRKWALGLGMWLVRLSGCEVVKP